MKAEDSKKGIVYLKCRNNCGKDIEESKMSSHLHTCERRPPTNEILVMLMEDGNEKYIEPPQWPASFPHTKEVFQLIERMGLKPPSELTDDHTWIDVKPRSKKVREPGYKIKNNKK